MNSNFLTMLGHIYDEVKMCAEQSITADGVSVIFFPKIDKAFIQDQKRTFWFDAAGINHALEQYYGLQHYNFKF